MDYISELSDHPSFKNLASGVTKATKHGYQSLSNAYNSTLDFQMHLAGYTNKELIKQIQDTEHNMQRSQKEYNMYRTRYRMLVAEMVKRDKRGQLDKSSEDIHNNDK